MSNQSRLIPVSYYNSSQEVRLSAYADTIVYEQEGPIKKILRAIRFGGYPEMVRGLADAVYAGATLDARVGDTPVRLECQVKRYQRQVSHDGVYAEATLLAIDDDQEAKAAGNSEDGDEEQEKMDLPPRKCIIFCPENDRDRLFEEVDRKTAVPLIPEFRDYVLGELEGRSILKRLHVISLQALRQVLKTDKKAAKKILSAYLDLLTAYPDQPYDQPEIDTSSAQAPYLSLPPGGESSLISLRLLSPRNPLRWASAGAPAREVPLRISNGF